MRFQRISRVCEFSAMATSSMSLEEKIEALTISYQTTAKTNAELTQRLQELDNQNEYLRK